MVHVAGTNGKGSTCSFTESFLKAHSQRTGLPCKTGLYTSPHLILPEERIRLNSEPISPTLFSKYFFEVYDKLPQLAVESDHSKSVVERGPRSLQLYALLAFHVFISEEVDVTIIETHSGGEYDATNVVRKPVVTAVTSLGMDHVAMLGPTIKDIAWHKAGIYKTGSATLSTEQQPVPAQVLRDRAKEKGETVQFVDLNDRLPKGALQLSPPVQKKNASLAAAAAQAFLQRKDGIPDPCLTDDDLRLGVEQWSWPGRFQVIRNGKRTWFLDAAHNEMSVSMAAQWFADSVAKLNAHGTCILIFSHINGSRDAVGLLESLANSMQGFDLAISHVIFTTYDESEARRDSGVLERSPPFHNAWRKFFPDSQAWDEATIRGAIERVRTIVDADEDVYTFITGSQHLVGPALRVLQSR